MKKLILAASGIFLAASLYIGINSYKNINSETDLLLTNVEALTRTEIDPKCRGCATSPETVFCCYLDVNGVLFKLYYTL